jgi:hypothetical protein
MFKCVTLVLWCCLCTLGFAKDDGPVAIQEDTPAYTIKIQYPQNFSSAINAVIQKFVMEKKETFVKSASKPADLPANVPGKDSLYITYKLAFQNEKVLSIMFDLSTFDRGAAHPRNTMVSWNFINEQGVSLESLFLPESNHLSILSNFCASELLKKDISEKKWILEGTEPKNENYKIWHFNKDGLAIVFDTYQVAAYVYGPQTVIVPKSIIAKYIKDDVVKAVWGK